MRRPALLAGLPTLYIIPVIGHCVTAQVLMTNPRTFALFVVIAHWILAIGHLFIAARALPGPNNGVSWLAVILISSGHLCVVAGLWKLSDRPAGAVLSIFFLAALSADLYEHFAHTSANNIALATGAGLTGWFDASVFGLVALEILACLLGMVMFARPTPVGAV